MPSLEKIDLVFEHFSLPENVNQLIVDCKAVSDEICARDSQHGSIPEFVPADGRTCWNLLNSLMQQSVSKREPVFCEWGSGLGLVTLIASAIGMDATGIEIEEELIDLAREFSQNHAIPASFIDASIYPRDNPIPSLDYKDVDIFFAYPWPNEIVQLTELFDQVAVSGAIFVCYHGGRNYRVWRR